VHFNDPWKLRVFEAWKLRVLLFGGLFVLLLAVVNEEIFGLPIPPGLAAYLTIASGYFALDPQQRIEKSREQVLLAVFFPGAFVTALLPFYSLLSLALKNGW
jgi:hypothetical protein